MPYQVTLQPSGHTFNVAADTAILDAALDAGFNLPYGCKDGACGTCKGKVLSGQVDLGTAQDEALSAAERAAGMALFCCARPLSDLSIEVREIDAVRDIPVRTLPCRVQKLQKLADDVMAISLKLPANERLQFLAGQYIEFLLKDGKRRAFSLASPPHADEFLEIHVRRVPGGNFTDHVFTQMKERDIMRIEGPLGSFFLRENSSKPIILLAGGTGIAPIKGLIEHALHIGIKRPIQLYYGAKDRAGLYLNGLAEQWAAAHPHITYIPVLSEPAADDAWTGRTGLVHEAVLADHADLSAWQVYACGAPAMCEAAKGDFTARGLPPEEFFADVFSFAPR
ncbi:MAG: CDP-6-deoxy-delta-3,4-glucoseen reductase [Gammaproteobacteria bacterium]|nr:CDP-6-deoxy-delta-3,4-glucoseen reductase [Rhodocyclaceae bacterium]MBU3909181.1 CDP-6-deoxy-delta-3,4-glucoseen reductase [Gammaproteobacteria bacterium]MBU3990007.1 CDP-6-deoxy-delta-3,4-glucoseen reductase [Gammaproteobacteria bacterium]MBU4005659.1 CDP-6-deoxy-delta-3,4-glucoseen reductase [Gammaproteobacteria bacterium]MBU4020788.1 CDP-6-deoxy-delta-3,4-glucoseen reductase [Gammaproteobacteria bacterium]